MTYLDQKAEQQLKRRNCIWHSQECNFRRFRIDRCAHFGCYLPNNMVERHFCRSTKHLLRYWTGMAPRSSRVWKTDGRFGIIALVPPFAAWWRCRWRTSSSSQDQGNGPLGSTLRCCVKPKWLLYKYNFSEEYCNKWIDWNLLSCCIVRRWVDLQLPRRQDRSSNLPIHFQDQLNVTLHSCDKVLLYFVFQGIALCRLTWMVRRWCSSLRKFCGLNDGK